ncbi:MAG: ASCH domain-containing protein [Cyanobacteria bacterium J06626_18]
MLIQAAILEQIKSGKVTLAFRRWQRPTVKTGSTLKTAIGVLAIQSVETITVQEISDRDAQQAGYLDKDALMKAIAKRDGQLFKIALSYAREDPRIALRNADILSDDEFAAILQRLQKMDSRSQIGFWTRRVLVAIHQHPKIPATQLATKTGFEKAWLKTNIRKLKNLGLTISHQPGYTLSPRGIAILERLQQDVSPK